MNISVSASFIGDLIKKTIHFLKKIPNRFFVFKSKLTIRAGGYEKNYEENNKMHRLTYFSLIISNNSNKDLYINKKKILINNNFFHGVIMMDDQKVEESKFCLKKFEELALCLGSISGGTNFLTSFKKNSLLILPNKISVTMEINKKTCELGINREQVYKQYIGYLSGLFGIIPWSLPNKLDLT